MAQPHSNRTAEALIPLPVLGREMEHPVVSAGGGAINILLCKLGTVLIEEAQLLGGIRGELQYMKDELESMAAFLQDLAEGGNRRKQVKIWMKQVREVAYDVEDCVDDFTYHLGSTTSGSGLAGLFHRCIRFLQTVRVRRQIAKRIQELKARATSISDRNSRYGGNHLISGAEGNTFAAQPALSNITSLDIRTPTLFPEITKLVGIEARQSNLVNWDILRQIIQPVDRNGPEPTVDPLKGIEEWNVEQLANKLRGHLEDKRYLIVLDDIWTISAWEGIQFSLPNSHTGSRIIVTTRMKTVAQACCLHEYDRAYEIEPLTGCESSELFFGRIFGNRENCPTALKNISEKILGKCGGIPLAIVSIAGLLASTSVYSYDRWEKIYNSLGLELETSPWIEKLKKILELSYNDLPYHLKTCFLYLSTYPEDHKVRRKSLLRRWIAERFVSEKRGLSALEVAEKYFDEFLNRSIVHPVEMSFDGKVKTFRVHDIMLEIIVSKSIDENFITLMGEQHTLAPQEKIRRLSIHGGRHLKKLGTLDVRDTAIKHLPPCITNLPNLSNLLGGRRAYNYSGLYPISDFWGMHIPNKLGNLEMLTTLAQIEITDSTSHYISELGKLSQFRKLGVMMFLDDDMNWMSLIAAISKLSSCLQSLLIWRPDGIMNFRILDTLSRPPMFLKSINFRGKLPQLPEWIGLLANLTELTLRATELESEKHLKVLSQLPSLLYLRLHHGAYTGRALTFSASEFPTLILLTIHLAVYQALNLRFEEGTTPKLHRLELSFFENASIRQPSGINFLANLQEVLVHADPSDNSEDMVRYLMDEASRNPSQPTVTFKAKQWKPTGSRTDPPIDHRANAWF
ncbi:disease resistance protein RPM1 [Hordeum vulgare]|nr:disease resistance protein RPM1 [Hordeum vulgare]